mmetsp:Transcript_9030/g.21367  ORF Transcript_9030/g.21367 Transcript_9030/m.21367 type:complete len:205 (+) Transcript_9030:605-1219(+)
MRHVHARLTEKMSNVHEFVIRAHGQLLWRHLLRADRPVLIVDVVDFFVLLEYFVNPMIEDLHQPQAARLRRRPRNRNGVACTHFAGGHLPGQCRQCVGHSPLFVEQQVNHLDLISCTVVPRDLQRFFGLVIWERDLQNLVKQRVRCLLKRREHLLKALDAAVFDRLRLRQVREGVVHRQAQAEGVAAQCLAQLCSDLVVAHALV